MRFLVLFFAALLVVGCGESSPLEETKPPLDVPTATSPAVTPKTPLTARSASVEKVDPKDAPLATIRANYQRIETARRAGTLTKDSLFYNCEQAMTDGSIYFYSDDSGVVLASHGYSMGDHGGATEYYYYRDGKLIFYFEQGGHWQFGGPMQVLPDGTEVPGTIDKVIEKRRYYHADTLIKALIKNYHIQSGEDGAVKAAEATNRPDNDAMGMPTGKRFAEEAIAAGKVDCEAVESLLEY